MTDTTDATDVTDAPGAAWFSGLDPADLEAAGTAIDEGTADAPADWPELAVEVGYADSEADYYRRLHEATMAAARAEVRKRERADDAQLVHAVRAMDDAERVANELTERVLEWAGTRFDDVPDGSAGVDWLADREPDGPAEERLLSLAGLAADLGTEADEHRAFIERQAPAVAPNLAEMAGPVLAARLIALAGGLETLAKKPAGTVQLLGAEDALFAHLSGRAPSPKHGVIYTHEYVKGTHPDDRGSAARAFAGKLAIAARIDHYSGEHRPEIHEEMRDRIETIRARRPDASGGDSE
ncbi:NOP5/NOP56 family protein [Halalkaliarchaeum sp. AArc-GB]|uniref:NOP5/NOP56 family protein n=1 Tax=Halalkaliarchaeum sp. AArc-GB TaxID=3074078 RepID=UPI00285EC12F|nr:NOP5/NOP56 family protein [Halalkaliarchaeum sp. AArc-GB]MDR5674020.1 NOP5/NOP56 family protein [Halalkaliarchaeum sp. AArc-GB]